MPKGTKLYCPECNKEYTQWRDEVVYCTGKATPNSTPHKKPRRMKEKT